MSELKIISWNVNGIRTRIKNKDVNPVIMRRWIRNSWINVDMNTTS